MCMLISKEEPNSHAANVSSFIGALSAKICPHKSVPTNLSSQICPQNLTNF